MKILIVGMGLIGGSVCKALKNKTRSEEHTSELQSQPRSRMPSSA